MLAAVNALYPVIRNSTPFEWGPRVEISAMIGRINEFTGPPPHMLHLELFTRFVSMLALDKLARRERRGGRVDRMIRIDIYIYIQVSNSIDRFSRGCTRFSVWRRGETGFACSASAPSIYRFSITFLT